MWEFTSQNKRVPKRLLCANMKPTTSIKWNLHQCACVLLLSDGILVPRAVVLLASPTDRKLWPGQIFWSLPVNCEAAKFENVWSDLIISDLILLYLIRTIKTSPSFGTCPSSRSVSLAKRVAARTRMMIWLKTTTRSEKIEIQKQENLQQWAEPGVHYGLLAEPRNGCFLQPMDLISPEIIFTECWILAYPSRHISVARKSSRPKPELCRPICYDTYQHKRFVFSLGKNAIDR